MCFLFCVKQNNVDDHMHKQKIIIDKIKHCQVEDTNDPSTDASSCCSVKPFCTGVL